MSAWLDWALQVPGDLAGETWMLTLRVTPPGWLLVLVGAAIVVVGWFSYAGLRGARPFRAALAVLRMLAITWLIMLMLGPMIEWPRERTERDVVHVLVDRSLSMSVRDERDGLGQACTRDQVIREALANPVWKRLGETHDILWHAFAGRSSVLGSIQELPAPDGDRTLLASSVQEVLGRGGSRATGAIVLITDGRSQDAPDEALMQRLRSLAAPVISISLGDPAGLADLALQETEHPQRAFPKDRVPVQVVVRGTAKAPIRVALRDRPSGKVLEERMVELDASGLTRVSLVGVQESAGSAEWEVVIVQERPDADPSNDRREVRVDFVDRPVRVLYIDGWPRWEYRYLKNLLLREAGMESSVMLLSADRDFAQEGTAPLARLPATTEEFQAFDVVIIGDVPGSFLDDARQRILRELVAKRGTGMLWIGGPRATPASWRGTPLEDLLPFQEATEIPRWDEPIMMQPTETATRSGLLRLDDGDMSWPPELGPGGASWARLEWAQRIDPRSLKPTVETWAMGMGASNDKAPSTPLVLAMRFGAGTTTYVATDETWRWRHGRGETLPERFWIQIIRHLARQGLRDTTGVPSIEVDPTTAAVDQPVRVMVDGVGDTRLEQLVVEAELTETGEVSEIVVRPAGDGRFSAPWSPSRVGRWTLRAARGASWKATEADLLVRSEQPEQVDTRPDTGLLERLAAPTTGRVIRPAQIDQLPDMIPSRSVIVRQPIQRPLWDRWPLYAVLAGLLALEWLGRRVLGLA